MGYLQTSIKGLGFMTAFRVLYRIIGIIRVGIIARILTPFDFGLFGIVTITISFLEIITETGINIFLIQEEEKIDKYINTAWVLSIFRGIIISIAIFLSAPLIAYFFNSPQSVNLLKVVSILPIIKGFINPSIVKFQQELKFKNDFFYRTSFFMVESIFTVVFCLYFRSPIGLIYGLIGGSLYELIYTFIIAYPRPSFRFEIEKAKQILGRGKWITLYGVSDYLYTQADNIIVGRMLGLNSLGIYQNAYKISTAPLTEIGDVFFKVSFPIFSKISGDKDRLKRAFIKNTLANTILMLFGGVFIFVLAGPIVNIIFGSGWSEAVPVVRLLSVLGVVRGIAASTNSLLVSLKLQKYSAIITLTSAFGLLISIVPLIRIYGIIGAGMATIIGVTCAIPLIFYYVRKSL